MIYLHDTRNLDTFLSRMSSCINRAFNVSEIGIGWNNLQRFNI